MLNDINSLIAGHQQAILELQECKERGHSPVNIATCKEYDHYLCARCMVVIKVDKEAA